MGGAGEVKIFNTAPYPLFKVFLPYSTPVATTTHLCYMPSYKIKL